MCRFCVTNHCLPIEKGRHEHEAHAGEKEGLEGEAKDRDRGQRGDDGGEGAGESLEDVVRVLDHERHAEGSFPWATRRPARSGRHRRPPRPRYIYALNLLFFQQSSN